MKIVKYIITVVFVTTLLTSCTNEKKEQIRVAVENQLKLYPKLTLQDLYKSFFQDYFGPEHNISDTAHVSYYLNRDIDSYEQLPGVHYEPTGYNNNFYRVNLSLVKEGVIPRDVFFNAFLRSAHDTENRNLDEWKSEWKTIDSVIKSMKLSLVNYAQDREAIFSLLEGGEFVMHHSEIFKAEYDTRYRIIERNIFQKEILPLINQTR